MISIPHIDGVNRENLSHSIVETAKANCIDPHDYLTLIFKELPRCLTADELDKLLPYNAKRHFQLKTYQAHK